MITPITREKLKFEWLDSTSTSLRTQIVYTERTNIDYGLYDFYKVEKKGKYEIRLYNSVDNIIGAQNFTVK